MGSLGDLDLVLRVKKISEETGEDVMVVAGDMMFQVKSSVQFSLLNSFKTSIQDRKFDLSQLINFRKEKSDGDLAMYYELDSWEMPNTRGMVEVCPFSNRILK